MSGTENGVRSAPQTLLSQSKGFRPPYTVRRSYKWTYLYAAVEPATGESFCMYLPGMDDGCLEIFLNQLSEAYLDHHLLVVLDGAPSHRSEQITHPENISLLILPPYSPELRDSHSTARGSHPDASVLLGRPRSPQTTHWLSLVGRGCGGVVTSITRNGITCDLRNILKDKTLLSPVLFGAPGPVAPASYTGILWYLRL